MRTMSKLVTIIALATGTFAAVYSIHGAPSAPEQEVSFNWSDWRFWMMF